MKKKEYILDKKRIFGILFVVILLAVGSMYMLRGPEEEEARVEMVWNDGPGSANVAVWENDWVTDAELQGTYFARYATVVRDTRVTDEKMHPPEIWVKRSRTSPPFLMAMPPMHLDLLVARNLILYGQWDRHIMSVMRHFLAGCRDKPDTVFVDVGANVGFHTLYAAALGCQVLSIEPSDASARFVQYGVELNRVQHRVRLFESIAGAAHGRAVVVQPAQSWGNAFVDVTKDSCEDIVTAPTVDCEDAPQCFEVAVAPLEAMLADAFPGNPVALFKIDVEGFEWLVLQGMRSILGTPRVPTLVLEFHPYRLELRSKLPNGGLAVLTHMVSLGYSGSVVVFYEQESFAPGEPVLKLIPLPTDLPAFVEEVRTGKWDYRGLEQVDILFTLPSSS